MKMIAAVNPVSQAFIGAPSSLRAALIVLQGYSAYTVLEKAAPGILISAKNDCYNWNALKYAVYSRIDHKWIYTDNVFL